MTTRCRVEGGDGLQCQGGVVQGGRELLAAEVKRAGDKALGDQ